MLFFDSGWIFVPFFTFPKIPVLDPLTKGVPNHAGVARQFHLDWTTAPQLFSKFHLSWFRFPWFRFDVGFRQSRSQNRAVFGPWFGSQASCGSGSSK